MGVVNISIEPPEELKCWIVLSICSPYLLNSALMHHLQDLGKIISVVTPILARVLGPQPLPCMVCPPAGHHPADGRGQGGDERGLQGPLPGVPNTNPLHRGGHLLLPVPGTRTLPLGVPPKSPEMCHCHQYKAFPQAQGKSCHNHQQGFKVGCGELTGEGR